MPPFSPPPATAPPDPAIWQRLGVDPGAFLHQIDGVQRSALFVRVAEAEIRAASFLDERLGLKGRDAFRAPLSALPEVATHAISHPLPTRFIFHVGHCGSTLLSRLLEQGSVTLGLREPLVLRELASAERELDSPTARYARHQWQQLLFASLRLIGRPFTSGQAVTIKATSHCNNLIPPLLETIPGARLVLLHMPLQNYLATLLKAPSGGLDALHAASARLASLHATLADDSIRLHQLDHVEILAMGWLAEVERFMRLEATQASSVQPLMLFDFEAFLQQPFESFNMICRHLAIPNTYPDEAAFRASSVWSGYAKSPSHAYSPSDRQHDLDLARRRFADEIVRGLRWVEAILPRLDLGGRIAGLLR